MHKRNRTDTGGDSDDGGTPKRQHTALSLRRPSNASLRAQVDAAQNRDTSSREGDNDEDSTEFRGVDSEDGSEDESQVESEEDVVVESTKLTETTHNAKLLKMR